MPTRRNQALSALEQFLVSAGNFLLIVLSARALGANEQGKLAYVIAFAIAARTLLRLAVTQNMFAVAPRRPDAEYSLAMAVLGVCVSVGSTLLVVGSMYLLIGDRYEGWQPTITEAAAVAAFVLTSTLIDYERAAAYAFGDGTGAILISAFVFPVRSAILLIMPLIVFTDALWICSVVSVPVIAVSVWRLLEAQHGLARCWPDMREHLHGSRWLVASMPVSFIRAQSPVLLVGEYLGLAASGILITVRSVTNIVNIGLEYLGTYLSAMLGRAHADDRESYRRYAWNIAIVGILVWLVGVVAFAGFGESILALVSGGRHEGYVDLLLWLWSAMACVFLARLLHVHLRQVDRTRAIAVSQYLAAAATIIAIIALIPRMGLDAAGIGVFAGSAVMMTWSAIAARS